MTSTQSNPFAKAAAPQRRLKLFLWGDSGAGKTTLALQFPSPVVIDMEGGTELYSADFEFDVLQATSADEVMEAIDWLLRNKHPYRTLVIDPITIYWEALQKKWSDIFLKRNKGSKGFKHEFYDLQPRDWMTLKAEFKDLVRKLLQLDMNVVVTARQKTLYADSGFMRKVGDTFDGEKSLPYLFDTIVRLHRGPKGEFLGECLKDRSNRVPTGDFECTYPKLERLLRADVVDRETAPKPRANDEQLTRIANLIYQLGLDGKAVLVRLRKYGAYSLQALSEDAAAEILSKLEAAANATAVTNHAEEA